VVSQAGNDGTSVGKVVLALVVAMVIGFVIANAAGRKDGCAAQGGKQVALECVMPTPTP
jgi:hypothetical protein